MDIPSVLILDQDGHTLPMVIMNTQPVKTEGDWDSLKHSVIMKINALRQLAPTSTVEQLADAISNVPTINVATEETVASNSVIDRTSTQQCIVNALRLQWINGHS